MHLKRQEITRKLPIERKGTTYVVRASSDINNSVPILIAVRDMLHLAKTQKEVKKMVHEKMLKINSRNVEDYRESIKLFNLLEAGKKYVLTLLKTGRFAFEETKESSRLCKVTGRKLVSGNRIQISMHDGTNLISKDKINIEDSVYLSHDNKITKHVSFEKGKKVFISSGRYMGFEGTISSIEGKKAKIKLKDKEEAVELSAGQLFAQ